MTESRKKKGHRKSLLSVVFFAWALVLTGCGEEPYELQDNEREIIVNYAAHIIAKYNVKQPEGYRYVYVDPEDEPDEPEESSQETVPEESAEEETQADEQAHGDDPADSEDIPFEEEPSVTLSEALGLKAIQAVYTGTELTDRYGSVVPESGKRLMILHVTLQNQTGEKQMCDILSLLPIFRAKVNGTREVTAELTILPENLSTWEEAIPANSSADTIILFQVKEDAVVSVEHLELDVTIGGKTSRVEFL